MPKDDRLVWIDVETTGLNPHAGERLLEVACLVTDTDLNLLDETGFQRVIHHDAEATAALREGAVPVVREMHDRTGLWQRLSDGAPLDDVDAELVEYIRRFAPGPRQGRVAGSSIRLDMNFLDAYLPRVAGHLHYRFVDVSTVTALTGWWIGQAAVPAKAAPHQAMADIRGSLDELRALRDVWLGQGVRDVAPAL